MSFLCLLWLKPNPQEERNPLRLSTLHIKVKSRVNLLITDVDVDVDCQRDRLRRRVVSRERPLDRSFVPVELKLA